MKSHLTPHGSGFSFIDEFILSDSKGSLTAKKWLDPEMPFFVDHFPNNPLMPGVLLIECAAQACGILWSAHAPDDSHLLTMLAQVQQFKIKQSAFPNQTLEIHAALQRDFGNLAQFEVALFFEKNELAVGVLILGRKTSTPLPV